MKRIFLLIIISVLIFTISCEKEVSVTAPEPLLPTGKLFVASYPEEALIFLNSKFTGSLTPDTIFFLEEGVFNLTLKKKWIITLTI